MALVSSGFQIEFTIRTGILRLFSFFSVDFGVVMRLKQMMGLGEAGIFQGRDGLPLCRRKGYESKFPVDNDAGYQRCKSDGDK